jgi:hypothetical protein
MTLCRKGEQNWRLTSAAIFRAACLSWIAGVEEVWCALSSRATDGTHVRDRLRDILFAALERRFPGATFEVRGDWPAGQVGWWEVVRLGLR